MTTDTADLGPSNFVKAKRIFLRKHPNLDEAWVQGLIANDPSILGLGDLVLKDKELPQPSGGRLDLLLRDSETDRRFEVEVQLGATDPSHIIRTLEYWDVERKRYPQLDHCAVIVAEEITGRFLNVISLFNGHIPLIALQMTALSVKGHLTLVFTRVVDEIVLGMDEDETEEQVADRDYWENRRPESLKLADRQLPLVRKCVPEYDLKYNKAFIGLQTASGKPDHFVRFRGRKKGVITEVRIDRSEEVEARLADAGIDLLERKPGHRRYRLKLTAPDIDPNADLLTDLFRQAHGGQDET
ncbi:hypothetical protein ACFL59_08900 [Planctomycetota bacterium]